MNNYFAKTFYYYNNELNHLVAFHFPKTILLFGLPFLIILWYVGTLGTTYNTIKDLLKDAYFRDLSIYDCFEFYPEQELIVEILKENKLFEYII